MIGLIRLYLKNIYKTLYFNFKFLPFKQAIKLPIVVNRHVVIKKSKGKVIINQNSNKKIWIGFPCLNDTSIKTDETIIFIDGIMEFKGEAFIANGMRIDVKSSGKLILGDGFNTTGKAEIVCAKKIEFGSKCTISWDTLFMDTDSHSILRNAEQINKNNAISIGNHCWIGCRTMILKGVAVADDSIIASGTILTKSCNEQNAIWGTNGKMLKNNIQWTLDKPE
ncbi:acyltransferase [Blautia sp.]